MIPKDEIGDVILELHLMLSELQANCLITIDDGYIGVSPRLERKHGQVVYGCAKCLVMAQQMLELIVKHGLEPEELE